MNFLGPLKKSSSPTPPVVVMANGKMKGDGNGDEPNCNGPVEKTELEELKDKASDVANEVSSFKLQATCFYLHIIEICMSISDLWAIGNLWTES